MDTKQILESVVYGMVVLAILEGMYVYFTSKKGDPKEVAANIGVWLLQKVWRESLGIGTLAFGYLVLAKFIPYQLPSAWWSWAIAIIGADFVYYWKHRYEHEVRLLWAYHSVHHSSEEFNLSTAIRLPMFGSFSSFLFHAPLLLLGLSPVMIIVSRQLVLLYQYWVHSNQIGELGKLEKVFNTPSAHRVHHGSNIQYLDRNYGGIFIFWDRLFKTFTPESKSDPVIFGLTKPIQTKNPLRINFIEPLAIARDVIHASSLKDATHYLLDRPGWQPIYASKAQPAAAIL